MANPTIIQTYPANNDTGIPIGISLEVLFSHGVDIETVKNNIVLYGADFDQTSGPDGIIWTNNGVINQQKFLTSPGFTGIVPCTYRTVYWDLTNDEEVDPGLIESQADEITADVGHKVYVTPEKPLAANTVYHLYIIGDPDGIGSGISARTIFDVVPDGGNASTDGDFSVAGAYNGSDDILVVEITTSGDINTAKYLWYFDSETIAEATTGRVTSKFPRKLDKNLQIKFDGSNFQSGDLFNVNLFAPQRLQANHTLSFTTNDGSFTEAPESPSTPASSLPPSSILETTDNTGKLEIVSITPEDRSYNISVKTNQIVIEFSDNLDATTITQDSVKLKKFSVLKGACSSQSITEMKKSLTVDDNILTIDF